MTDDGTTPRIIVPEPPSSEWRRPLTPEAALKFAHSHGHILMGYPALPWDHCLRCCVEALVEQTKVKP